MEPIRVTPHVWIEEGAIRMHAVRAAGPGGQNVNKVSSKVELRVAPDGIVGLSPEQRRRLDAKAARYLDDEGRIVVTSQLTRSQSQNLEDAREKVRVLVESALVAPPRRIATKPTRASKRRRLDSKRRLSEKKQSRRTRDG
ncbi:MAG TPA: alternative ribosome rescue aminoacyl-tRNA hydrolase ArfB [Polyangiaceae bacterium]|nr:alternative ribosome rescue aminoacyl-tRNA hydrolase ArfB [Polyangiaceae bacterium]